MIFHTFAPDRLKCSQSHMEGHLGSLDASLSDLRKNSRSEMESCGRGRHRSPLPRIDRLIPLPIWRCLVPRDVRWQWDVPDVLDRSEEIIHVGKPYVSHPKLAAGYDLCAELITLSEKKSFSNTDLASGTHQALPFIRFLLQLLREQDLALPLQKLPRRRILWAHPLRLQSCAPSI